MPSQTDTLDFSPRLSGQTEQVETDCGPVAMHKAGQGPALLLVHSINAAGSAAEVRPLHEHYASRRTVFSIDLPGFGASARRAELEGLLKKARVTDFTEARADAISIGSTVTLLRGADQVEITYDILGVWDGKPEENVLSYISPLAKQFLNQKLGETFTTNINGKTETWKVKALSRWIDKRK